MRRLLWTTPLLKTFITQAYVWRPLTAGWLMRSLWETCHREWTQSLKKACRDGASSVRLSKKCVKRSNMIWNEKCKSWRIRKLIWTKTSKLSTNTRLPLKVVLEIHSPRWAQAITTYSLSIMICSTGSIMSDKRETAQLAAEGAQINLLTTTWEIRLGSQLRKVVVDLVAAKRCGTRPVIQASGKRNESKQGARIARTVIRAGAGAEAIAIGARRSKTQWRICYR